MISNYDVIKAFKKANSDEVGYKLDDAEKNIVNIKTGEIVCTVDEYVCFMRKKLHCDFEVIYQEHVSLEVVYRCKECGTIIFGGDDERYDSNLSCPHCGEYKTSLKYWTQEEIDADISKKEQIETLKQMQKYSDEYNERVQRRKKLDSEIWKKTISTKNGQIKFSLECVNLFSCGLKGLEFKITSWKDKLKDGFLTWDKDYYIPLSFFAIKMCFHRQKLRKNLKEKNKVTV